MSDARSAPDLPAASEPIVPGADGETAQPGSARLAAAILAAVGRRGVGRTICPSEVARALAPERGDWRALMPAVREVAAQLANDGRLAVTQRGVPVEACAARGPIRLGLPSPVVPSASKDR